MRFRSVFPAVALACTLFAGCGGERPEAGGRVPDDRVIELSKVPEGVMKVARQTWPGVEYEEAWLGEAGGGEVTYEVRGKDEQGKTREVKVSASGRVIEKE